MGSLRIRAGLAAVVLVVTLGPVEAGATVESTPVEAAPAATEFGSSDWRQVSAGAQHTCGIRASGRLFCWGSDNSGRLGTAGPDENSAVPVQVAGGATNWASVSAGNVHTCARKTNGRLFCWGSDGNAQLGTAGPDENSAVPVQVAGGATNWADVSAGNLHTCARKKNGRLFCWGSDLSGRLGTAGPDEDSAVPVQVAGGATNWASVSAGRGHTCARKRNGRLFCWGSDGQGRLGTAGPDENSAVPVQVAGGATNWASVSTGDDHTCARRTNRRIFCWGADGSGQLGDGGVNASSPTPVQVAGGATDWAQHDSDEFHNCARTVSGRLFCWGSGNSGRLGNGDDVNRLGPTEVRA